MRLTPFVLLIFAFGLALPAKAQQIVYEDGNPNPFVAALRKGNEDSVAYVPEMSAANPEGSALVASGDFFNSDVTILVKKEQVAPLIRLAKALAQKIGRPDTVIRVRFGRVIGGIDMEFNRYMRREGNTSIGVIPLGEIVRSVSTWSLPKPFGVALNVQMGSARFHGQEADKMLILNPGAIVPSDEATYTVERHWYGLVGGLFFAGLILSVFGMVFVQMLRPPKTPTTRPKPTSFAEAQARYEGLAKSPKRWLGFLPIAAIVAIPLAHPVLMDATAWVPPAAGSYILGGSFGFFVLVFIGACVRRKRGTTPKVDAKTEAALRPLKWMLLPVLLMGTLLTITTSHPQWLYGLSVTGFRILIAALLVVPLVGAFIVSRRSSNRTRQTLASGDPDYDAAMEFANQAGVRISSVQVRKTMLTVNAYASLFRTVGITEAMRERLTPQERRCVLAHEIGHLKYNHVPWIFLFGILFISAYTTLIFCLDKFYPSFGKFYVTLGPLPLFVFLMALQIARAPFQKKAEYAADRFALEAIGDFDELAYALAKTHLLNSSPYQLRKFHESLSSHPPLLKRLEGLESAAREMGMKVEPGASERLINQIELDPMPDLVSV